VSGSTGAEVERALWALRAYDATALATVSAVGPHVVGVFFAPEIVGSGINLVLAVVEGSRPLRDMAGDPRVAFMCSPGNTSRWIQGAGTASIPELDDAERMELFRRLAAHAPGAQEFVDRLPVQPVIVTVTGLRVVEAPGRTLTFDFA
jgi:hypothetical protein